MFEELSLERCDRCSFVFAQPLPLDKDLFEYNSSYFDNAHGGLPKQPMAIAYQSAINKIRVEYVIGVIRNLNKGISNIVVLEVGPGTGDFQKSWIDHFPNTEYSILESDLQNRDRLKKNSYNQYSSLEEIPSNYFDLIVVSHVLEHTNNPQKFVSGLVDKLKKEGLLFIEVPCEDYLFKEKDEPHLLFFNQKSMLELINVLGLQVVDIGYFGPKIKEFFLIKILRVLYSKISALFFKKELIFPIYYFFPKMRRFLSDLEIVSVISFEAIVKKSKPAWWLRTIVRKR